MDQVECTLTYGLPEQLRKQHGIAPTLTLRGLGPTLAHPEHNFSRKRPERKPVRYAKDARHPPFKRNPPLEWTVL
jgi:hypothetical protein